MKGDTLKEAYVMIEPFSIERKWVRPAHD